MKELKEFSSEKKIQNKVGKFAASSGIGAGLILLIPLTAMLFSGEVKWSVMDFVIAWILIAGSAFIFKLVASRMTNFSYKAAAAIAVFTSLVLIWANLAVGIIGSEDNPVNLLFFGVIVIEFVGLVISKFKPMLLARTMMAAALFQFMIPVAAFIIMEPDFTKEVAKLFGFNLVFVMLFGGAGLLFRQAALADEKNELQFMSPADSADVRR